MVVGVETDDHLRFLVSWLPAKRILFLSFRFLLPAPRRLLCLAVGLGIFRGLRVEPEFVLGVLVQPEDLARMLDEDRLLPRLLRHLEPRRHQRGDKILG